MLLCHVLHRSVLVFEFQLARATALNSFHVLEHHVIVHAAFACSLGTTESASAFVFRKVESSVGFRLLQGVHICQTARTVAVEVNQAASESAIPAQQLICGN